MKILVTGGGGFLGKEIARRLIAEGHEVWQISRGDYSFLEKEGIRCIQGDILDSVALTKATRDMDAVIHTAAKVGLEGNYDEFFQSNVIGTRRLIEAMRLNGVSKLVYTSSPSVVFGRGNHINAKSDLPYPKKYDIHYAATKALAEQEVIAASSKSDLTSVILRPHIIWGVGDNQIIPQLLHRSRLNSIRVIGSGKNKIGTCHVENAAHAHVCALKRMGPEISGRKYFITNDEPKEAKRFFNDLLVACGRPPSNRHIGKGTAWAVAMISEFGKLLIPGYEPRITRFGIRQLTSDHWYDMSEARRDLGYEPCISYDQGIEQLTKYYRGDVKC